MAKTIDLRTYLLLERAFARRLQRSWQQQSAPLYARITQACLDHKWDEARRLVPDLDMTEVGTENREWIQYMLLSCAVFGASTVKKGKPSFVGVGTFDTFLKQVTNNMLQYLELSATAQVQAEALQLIAEDEAKTKALKREYVRDAKGQFAETVGKALIKAGRVTTDPNNTFFLLPNGTRVTAAGYNSHAKLAAAAGYNDLNKVIESGVVRYIPGVGIEANHLTETQARIVVEDWEAYFAGPKGWNAIQVDLIGREDRLVLGASSMSHRFDRLSVDALLNFVNRTTKWDEAKHPRDKEGQFASSGEIKRRIESNLTELKLEGGGGPERAKWVKLNETLMDVTDVYMDVKEEHRKHLEGIDKQLLDLAETGADMDAMAALETKLYTSPEYYVSLDKRTAAAKVMNQAEIDLKAQQPAMAKEVVTNLATQVAKQLKIDPSIIDVVYQDAQEFTVGEKHFTEAGHYMPSTGRIELNAGNIHYGNASGVKGIVAHEISHAIYHSLKDEAEKEFARYLEKAITPDGKEHSAWFHERFISEPHKLERTLRPQFHAEFAKNYPASTVLAELSDGDIFLGLSTKMINENGHSQYAKSYWSQEAIANNRYSYESAINETIAEITRYIAYPSSWHLPDQAPQPSSPWVKLTTAMHQWYGKQQQARA